MSTTPERVYISGPMSGIADHNFPAFNAAAARLRAAGLEVVNPAEINVDTALGWHECLRKDMAALADCTTLALLPGWQNSNGAHLELHVAHRLGMRIVLIDELVRLEAGEADIGEAVAAELARAVNKFPTWPTDPLHALAVLGEEFGELTKAMLQLTYEPQKTSAAAVRTEAIQTAAMAMRLAMSLGRYEYRQCPQHVQGEWA